MIAKEDCFEGKILHIVRRSGARDRRDLYIEEEKNWGRIRGIEKKQLLT